MSNSFAKQRLLLALCCYTLYMGTVNADLITTRYVLPSGTTEISESSVGDPGSISSGPLGTGLIIQPDKATLIALDSVTLANQIIARKSATLAALQGVFTLVNNNTFSSLTINAPDCSGMVYLQGNNAIGSLHIAAGTLCLGSANAIGGAGIPLITMEGGSTLVAEKTCTLPNPIIGKDKVTLASSTGTLTLSGDCKFAVLDVNSGGYEGTINLAGRNAISSITLSSGILSLGQASSINGSNTPPISITSGATLLGTATLCIPNQISSTDTAVLASSKGVVTFSGNNSFSILNINGSGYERIVALTGKNAISSSVNIFSGTLAISSSDTLNRSGVPQIIMSPGSTLLSRGDSTLPNTIFGVSGCVTIASSTGTLLTLSGDNTFEALDINGAGFGGVVEFAGVNTVTASGVRVLSGTLAMHSANNIQGDSNVKVELNKDTTLLAMETCTLPHIVRAADACSLSAKEGTFTLSSNNVFTDLTINTGGYKGTVSLTGSNAISTININSGVFSIEAAENINSLGTPSIRMSGNTTLLGAKNLILANQITASGPVTFASKEGTFTLSGDNRLSELHIQGNGNQGAIALLGLNTLYALVIDSGSLLIETSDNINGAGVPSIQMGNNTQIIATKGLTLPNSILTLGSVTLGAVDNEVLVLSSNNTFSTLNINGTQGAGLVELSGVNKIGDINLLSGILAVRAEGNINKGTPPAIVMYPGSALLTLDTLTLPNRISASDVVAITAAKGTLTLSGSNTFSHLLINGGGGNGTVRLSGVNNAIDFLHIASGCFSIDSPSNINSTNIPIISMEDGAVLRTTASMELPNPIMGDGCVSVVVEDSRTLILSGNNTFSTLEFKGAGTKSKLTLSGINELSSLRISSGIFEINSFGNINGGSIPTIVMDRESTLVSYSSLALPNSIETTGDVTLTAISGVFTLSGNNNFSRLHINDNRNKGTIALTGSNAINTVIIHSGTLSISSASSLNAASEAKIVMGKGSTLLATESVYLPNKIDAVGRFTLASSEGTFMLAGDNHFSDLVINGNNYLGTISFAGSNEISSIMLLSGTFLLHSPDNINGRGIPPITMKKGSILCSKNGMVLANPITATDRVTLASESGSLSLTGNHVFSDLDINGNDYGGTVQLLGENAISSSVRILSGTLSLSSAQAINRSNIPQISLDHGATLVVCKSSTLSNTIVGGENVTIGIAEGLLTLSGNTQISSLQINRGLDKAGMVFLDGVINNIPNIHITAGALAIGSQNNANALENTALILMENYSCLSALSTSTVQSEIRASGSIRLSSAKNSFFTLSGNGVFENVHINEGENCGVVALTGTNVLSSLTVCAGTLSLSSPSSLNGSGVPSLHMEEGTMLLGTQTMTLPNTITSLGEATLAASQGSIMTLSADNMFTCLNINGSEYEGTIELTGCNQLSSLIVRGGILSISSLENINGSVLVPISMHRGATLFTKQDITLSNPLDISGPVIFSAAEESVLTLSGDHLFSLLHIHSAQKSGTVVLQGNNTISELSIGAGILSISSPDNINVGTIPGITMQNGATLLATQSLSLPNLLIGQGSASLSSLEGVFEVSNHNSFLSLSINSSGGKGTVKLSGMNKIMDRLTISSGTLEISSPHAINSFGSPSIYMEDESKLLGIGRFVLFNTIKAEGLVTIASAKGSLTLAGNGHFSSLRINEKDFIGEVCLKGKNAINQTLHVLAGTLSIATEQSINASGLPEIIMENGTTLLATEKAVLGNSILNTGLLTLSSRKDSLTVSSNNTFDTLHINRENSIGTVALTGKNKISTLEIYSGVLAMGTADSINEGGNVDLRLSEGDLLALSTTDYVSSGSFSIEKGGLSATLGSVLNVKMPLIASQGLFIGRSGGGVVHLSEENTIGCEIVIGSHNHPGALSVSALECLGAASSLTLQGEGKLIVTDSVALQEAVPVYLGKRGGSFIAKGSSTVLTLSGPVYGGLSDDLAIGGGGTVVVSGRNSAQGNLIVQDNTTLAISSLMHLGTDSKEAYLMLNSGNLCVTANSIESNRSLYLQGNNTIYVDTEEKVAFGKTVIVKETSLTKTGLGDLFLRDGTIVDGSIKILNVQAGQCTVNAALLGENSLIHIEADALLTLSHEVEDTPLSFNGSMSGDGSIHITGTAPIIFTSSSHSYSGGTRVTGILHLDSDMSSDGGGMLGIPGGLLIGGGGTIMATGSFSTARAILLEDETDTVFSSGHEIHLELSGNIGGNGGFVKDGPGYITLSGTSSFTGKTYVNAGTLNVAGNIISSPDPIVYDGAILVGTGSVGDTVVYGAIKGGNPTGTLTVAGTLLMEPGSDFIVALDSEGYSSVAVTDAVTIGEGVSCSLAIFPGAISSNVLELPILTGWTITGEFSSLSSEGFLFVEQNLFYSSSEVTLQITPITIADLASGQNALHVANALDAVVAYNRENVSYTISANGIIESSSVRLENLLDSLLPFTTTEEMTYALNQIHPAELKGLAISQENNAVQVNNTLLQRLQQEVDFCPCISSPKRAHTLWFSVLGESLTQQSLNESSLGPLAGYTTNTIGSVLGWDRYFSDHFYGGLLGGYTHSQVQWKESKGSGQINSGYGGLYFAALGKFFYGSVSVIGSWNGYQGKRDIAYPGVNRTAHNNHTGVQLLSHLDMGLNISINKFSIRPFDRFDYITQTERGYQEEGSGDWNLTVSKNNAILARNELGLLFSYCFTTTNTKWDIAPKCSWVREVRVKGHTITADLQGAESPFTVTGYFPDRSLVAPGVVVSGLMFKDFLALNLYYNGEFGSGYGAHNYGGTVNFSF